MVRQEFSNLINDNLILQLNGSNITSFSIRLCDFVGVFDKDINKISQPNIVDRRKRQVCATDIRLESGRSHPVEKVLSVVTRCEGYLLIFEIPEENNPVVRELEL